MLPCSLNKLICSNLDKSVMMTRLKKLFFIFITCQNNSVTFMATKLLFKILKHLDKIFENFQNEMLSLKLQNDSLKDKGTTKNC